METGHQRSARAVVIRRSSELPAGGREGSALLARSAVPTLPTLIVGIALLVSTNVLPEPLPPAASSPYLGEPNRKPKLTGTAIAVKRAQEIPRAEQRLAELKAQREEGAAMASEARVWGQRRLPEGLQRGIDANAAEIVETEALLRKLRSRP